MARNSKTNKRGGEACRPYANDYSILALLGFTACGNAQGSGSITTVGAKEFAKIIKADTVFLLDVRTADEFNVGHIDGAANIDVLESDFKERAAAALPHSKAVAVYCRSGKRSLKAAATLKDMGYKVINLRGGWIEWEEARSETRKDSHK